MEDQSSGILRRHFQKGGMKTDERKSPVPPTGLLYYDSKPEKKEGGTDKGEINHRIFMNKDFNRGGCAATNPHHIRAISLQAKNCHYSQPPE